MASQKAVRSTFFSRCIGACFVVFAMLSGSNATPSSGIVISDQIVGTTSSSFFVIRTTTLRPPTYYSYRKRVELVELSIASGKIEQRCLARETAYAYDHEATQETWNETELASFGCQIFKELSRRGANYIEPESVGPEFHELRLDDHGLAARRAEDGEPRAWQLILTLAQIEARAAETTKLSTEILPWQTDNVGGETISIIKPDAGFETVPEICELHSVPARALRSDQLFVKFVCWSGDDDIDGAIFYLPIVPPPFDG